MLPDKTVLMEAVAQWLAGCVGKSMVSVETTLGLTPSLDRV